MSVHCEYYEPIGDSDTVIGCPEEVGGKPLFFLWPLPDGGAVRAMVCKNHLELLQRLMSER